MKYRTLGAVAISIALLSARARAQEQDDADEDPGASQPARRGQPSKPNAEPSADSAKVDADVKAKAAEADEDVTASRIEPGSARERPPVYGKRSDWFIAPYGYARLDAIEDSTESFEDGIQPNLIQRAGTYRGDHRRTIFTARDSRLGVFVGAPKYQAIKTFGQLELDFYGLEPSDARRHDTIVFATPRIRLAFLKLETPLFDIVAGQYYDLFGWNSYFYVGTVGYLGVPAEIYHRNPQLRIEKKLHLGQLEVLAAVAAVRPGERDSGLPEGQAGLKVTYSGWSGAATSGFGLPTLTPLSIGVSALYRAFEVPVFRSEPGSASVKTYGYGLAASALLPIIPIKNIQDRGNSLVLAGEFTIGTGIADMYTFMDGGSRFPLLPNPSQSQPAIQYAANVDPGLVTFDRNLDVKTINWEAFVGNLQYYLPVDRGRISIEGTYTRVWSNNIKDLTPFPSWGGIFTKMEYIDANLVIAVTPAVLLGLSFQTVMQTFGDVSADTPVFGQTFGSTLGGLSIPGTGGVAAHARNNRGQLSMSFFF
jgi:hypothetical protein